MIADVNPMNNYEAAKKLAESQLKGLQTMRQGLEEAFPELLRAGGTGNPQVDEAYRNIVIGIEDLEDSVRMAERSQARRNRQP